MLGTKASSALSLLRSFLVGETVVSGASNEQSYGPVVVDEVNAEQSELVDVGTSEAAIIAEELKQLARWGRGGGEAVFCIYT